MAADIEARIGRSPLTMGKDRYRIFVANDVWRRRLIWNVVVSPKAGGVAMYPLSGRNVFLSGADFPRGELIAGDGTRIPPPRSLAYYGTHEITHVLTGERLGTVAYLRLPAWIREGLADYVAISPREPFGDLSMAMAGRPDGLEIWRNHGYYARYRLLVQFFLEVEGWSLERLLASGMSLEEATARMRASPTNPRSMH